MSKRPTGQRPAGQAADWHATDWREARRLRAWELYQQGWKQIQIAKELGVSRGAVSHWLKQVRDQGSLEALRRHPAPGQRARLTDKQFAQLPILLSIGASAFGFEGDQWTARRAASVIHRIFGVSYHPGHVTRILQKYCPGWWKIKSPEVSKHNEMSGSQP
jgi:transposase